MNSSGSINLSDEHHSHQPSATSPMSLSTSSSKRSSLLLFFLGGFFFLKPLWSLWSDFDSFSFLASSSRSWCDWGWVFRWWWWRITISYDFTSSRRWRSSCHCWMLLVRLSFRGLRTMLWPSSGPDVWSWSLVVWLHLDCATISFLYISCLCLCCGQFFLFFWVRGEKLSRTNWTINSTYKLNHFLFFFKSFLYRSWGTLLYRDFGWLFWDVLLKKSLVL